MIRTAQGYNPAPSGDARHVNQKGPASAAAVPIHPQLGPCRINHPSTLPFWNPARDAECADEDRSYPARSDAPPEGRHPTSRHAAG